MLATLVASLLSVCPDGAVCLADDQYVGGYKHFEGLTFFEDSYLIAGDRVSLMASAGIATDLLVAKDVGHRIVIKGKAYDGDFGADVIIKPDHYRNGGALLAVNSGACSGDYSVFSVNEDSIQFGQALTADCHPSPYGSLMDVSGISGHIALRRSPGLYLGLRGGLGASHLGKNVDGSDPGPGQPHVHCAEGACWYDYAGEHGDVDIGSGFPMYAGNLAEFYNPISGVGAYTDHRAFIHWEGGYAQNHWLNRDQFEGPQELTFVGLGGVVGQFRYGAHPSELMYGFDTNHWYFMKGFSGWEQLAEQSELEALKARVSALEGGCH